MTRWFARVGLPLSQDERAVVADWTRSVAPPAPAALTAVASWLEAAEIVHASDADSTWWDDEEAERERLWARATERWSESELLQSLDAATRGLNAQIRGAASAAAAGMVDERIVAEASSMALLAAHHRALAEMAGASADHRFVVKYALFAAGRWPLGYHFARLAVF